MEPFGLWLGFVPVRQEEFKEFLRNAEKLEAIKNQIDEFPCVHIQDYQRMMRKIEEILEAETDASRMRPLR